MEAIVLYPSPGRGHLNSMVELGKLILTQNPSFSIHILITDLPFSTGSSASSSGTPSITFQHLPTVPETPSEPPTFSSVEAYLHHLSRLHNPHVHHTLQSISLTSTVLAFIIDMFCTPSLEISTSLNIPSYYFFTSGICFLSSVLYLPTLDKSTTNNIKDLHTYLSIPDLPPIPPSCLPHAMVDKTTEGYQCFLETGTQMQKSAGVIVNSFESLESRLFKAVTEGLCIRNGSTPPIYCVGPLISFPNKTSGEDTAAECLTWLSAQPSKSVVFLSFGSVGLFPKEQLHEIAVGLEKSGQRFLWVVRSPPSQDPTQRLLPPPDPDFDSLLPDGFLDRSSGRGFVVKSWAPQVEVLNHDSIGGFVTHCGWNSVLESVCAGVPMIAWPLYAEQRLNKIMLVEEMKVALPMNEGEGGLVSAEEVEKRVRELIVSEEGKLVRERVIAKQEEAKSATSKGGTSSIALRNLFRSWKRI